MKSGLWTVSHVTITLSYIKLVFLSISMGEGIVQRFSVKKVSLKILENLQENTCARFSFLKKLVQQLY